MKITYLSLGSNLGDRKDNITQAIEKLDRDPHNKLLKISSFYETEPYGEREQPHFLNLALKMETSLSPEDLLKLCKKIEKNLKRKNFFHWGPRTIDIDILLYEDKIIKSKSLTIPHPQMLHRQFVLDPLFEIEEAIPYPKENGLSYLMKSQD